MATLRELRFARLNRIIREQVERGERERKAREEGKRKKRNKRLRIIYAQNIAIDKLASKQQWHEVRERNKQLRERKVCQLLCVNDQVLFLGMGARGKG